MEPLDENPTRRFSNRAADYARYRPSYPDATIDAILAGLPPPAELTVADIGAGTGISARLVADRGPNVFAVEPNEAMRGGAQPHARVRWVDGTAEATGLATGAVDLVIVAQAFHWFDAKVALPEFRRILRAGGRLAIFWNKRSRDDAFTLGYRAALEAVDGDAPAERSTFDPATVLASGCFVNLRTHVLTNAQALTEDELIGRAMSTSTVPREGPRSVELVRLLRALHARHRGADGCATMVYRTEVYVWDAV
ncbi:MAG: class I SAM-dependent methyltransferase [Planctomycetota bacterium]